MFDSSKTNNKTLLTDCDVLTDLVALNINANFIFIELALIVKLWPWHQTLTYLVPSLVPISSEAQIVPSVLELTLKSCRPPPPLTFEHKALTKKMKE